MDNIIIFPFMCTLCCDFQPNDGPEIIKRDLWPQLRDHKGNAHNAFINQLFFEGGIPFYLNVLFNMKGNVQVYDLKSDLTDLLSVFLFFE